MNGGPSSVTGAMANYSRSALRCTAGGAGSFEWPENIPPPFALRGELRTASGFVSDSVRARLMSNTPGGLDSSEGFLLSFLSYIRCR